jgi:hypothetical protein
MKWREPGSSTTLNGVNWCAMLGGLFPLQSTVSGVEQSVDDLKIVWIFNELGDLVTG